MSKQPLPIYKGCQPHTKMISGLKDYDYHLPPGLTASYPSLQRSAARLLLYQPDKSPSIQDRSFHELPEILKREDLLIVNNTRVSWRRFRLKRKSGARLEALFLKELAGQSWSCLLRGKSKLKLGERLYLARAKDTASKAAYAEKAAYTGRSKGGDMEPPEFIFLGNAGNAENAENLGTPSSQETVLLPVLAGTQKAAWKNSNDAEACFAYYGEVPIPPYLGRSAEDLDKERYQSVYARKSGSAASSVAAPTAGLHFCTDLLARLTAHGVRIENLELSLGYGTFAPLRAENFKNSILHTEEYRFSNSLAQLLNQKRKGRRIAVGTSTLRALEANFRRHGSSFAAGQFSTDLFLKPPDQLHTTQGLITNFHLPASSLLLLVAAYAGKKEILSVYKHAVQARYRFFSYGDAMLILL